MLIKRVNIHTHTHHINRSTPEYEPILGMVLLHFRLINYKLETYFNSFDIVYIIDSNLSNMLCVFTFGKSLFTSSYNCFDILWKNKFRSYYMFSFLF